MKRWICLLAALALLLGAALAEGAPTMDIHFEDGFTLSIPEGWVSYAAGDGPIRYALGDGAGERFLYILVQPSEFEDFEAVQAAIDSRADCTKTSYLDLNGHAFAAFISPRLNASGCSTLLEDRVVTFLFTPQDDSDYMLEVAAIMASFRAE